MREFSFTEETAKKVIRSQVVSRIPVMVVALAGALYVADGQGSGQFFTNKLALLIFFPVLIVSVSLGLLFGIRNGAKALMKNKFIVTDTFIERYTLSGRIIKLDFNKTVKYQLLKKGLLLTSSDGKMLIPSRLDKFDELLTLVKEKLHE